MTTTTLNCRVAPSTWVCDLDPFMLDHQSMVYNVAYRILGDQALATRATQDTFSRSWPVFARFRGESARLWLIRTVTGVCREQLRTGLGPHSDSPVGNDVTQDYLSALPPDQRITVVLSDVLRLSYHEIAAATGVSVGVVRTRLSEGRSRLRDALLAENRIVPKD